MRNFLKITRPIIALVLSFHNLLRYRNHDGCERRLRRRLRLIRRTLHYATGPGIFFIFYFLFFDKLGNNKIIELLFSLVKQGILRKPLFGLLRKGNLQRQRVLKTLMSPTGAISAKHFGHVLVSVLHNFMSPR